MKSGFDLDEARAIFRIAYAVNLQLDRKATGASPVDPHGPQVPSIHRPLWPDGWGLPPGSKDWNDCIFQSKLPLWSRKDKQLALVQNNQALLTYNASRNQYCLAFAGTTNKLNCIEDLVAVPVPAGPLRDGDVDRTVTQNEPDAAAQGLVKKWLHDLGDLARSSYRYVPEGYAPPRPPQMHLGFRLAFESLCSHAYVGAVHRTIEKALSSLPDGADLFVTGHSLGGGLTVVASAWLTSGNIAKKLQVKAYSFASPKAGNESFATRLDHDLTTAQRFFRVFHAIDSIPEVPFTIQTPKGDLNNPMMLLGLTGMLPQWAVKPLEAVLDLELPFGASWNFTHVGAPVVLSGNEPVFFTGDTWPAEYFPGQPPQPYYPVNPNDSTEQQTAEKQKQDMARQWWTHNPCVYAKLLESMQV